jgi:hypothetical protein
MPVPRDFTYVSSCLFAADEAPALAALTPWYDRLPLDPYIQGTFRRRRFSHYRGPAGARQRLAHMHFLQSAAVNRLAGGISRNFEEIEDGFIALPAIERMLAAFIAAMGFDPAEREIGVHQIRICCSPGSPGSPAPEGIHQDGFDYIGLHCIGRSQMQGGTTCIYPARNQPPLFRRDLAPGEAVYANDRTVFHFAEPIRPTGDGPGYWDLLVITA